MRNQNKNNGYSPRSSIVNRNNNCSKNKLSYSLPERFQNREFLVTDYDNFGEQEQRRRLKSFHVLTNNRNSYSINNDKNNCSSVNNNKNNLKKFSKLSKSITNLKNCEDNEIKYRKNFDNNGNCYRPNFVNSLYEKSEFQNQRNFETFNDLKNIEIGKVSQENSILRNISSQNCLNKSDKFNEYSSEFSTRERIEKLQNKNRKSFVGEILKKGKNKMAGNANSRNK